LNILIRCPRVASSEGSVGKGYVLVDVTPSIFAGLDDNVTKDSIILEPGESADEKLADLFGERRVKKNMSNNLTLTREYTYRYWNGILAPLIKSPHYVAPKECYNVDATEAKRLTEEKPGTEIQIPHDTAGELVGADHYHSDGGKLTIVDGAWIIDAKQVSHGWVKLSYNPKRAVKVGKNRITRKKRADSGVEKQRNKPRLIFAEDALRIYGGLLTTILESKHLTKCTPGMYSYSIERKASWCGTEQAAKSCIGLEKFMKLVFGKVIYSEELTNICERLHEEVFRFKPKLEEKGDIKLRQLVKRILRAGVTKLGREKY